MVKNNKNKNNNSSNSLVFGRWPQTKTAIQKNRRIIWKHSIDETTNKLFQISVISSRLQKLGSITAKKSKLRESFVSKENETIFQLDISKKSFSAFFLKRDFLASLEVSAASVFRSADLKFFLHLAAILFARSVSSAVGEA